MAYVTTDQTYYGPAKDAVVISASPTPYNMTALSHAKVSLIHDTTKRTIVQNTIVKIPSSGNLSNSLRYRASDPRGTYVVLVAWYSTSGKIITTAKSKFIYLT